VVQKIKSQKWRVQVRVGGRVEGHVWTSKQDAEREERDLKRQQEHVRAGMERPKDGILLVDHAAAWLRAREKTLPKATTEMDDSRLRNYVLPKLGHMPLQGVRTSHLREFFDTIRDESDLSNATLNRIRALLHTLFQDAFMAEKVIANPVARIPLLPERPVQPRPLSRVELAAILDAAESDRLMVLTFVYTGGRVSQVVALQNRDFVTDRRELHFVRIFEQETGKIQDRIKGKPEGVVMPLFPVLEAAYSEHLKATPFSRPTDFVFCREDGSGLSTYAMRARIKAIAVRAGLPRVTPHVLRATFATLAEEAGYSKEDVQRMLGHSSVQVTQKYTRRSVEPLIEKGDRLGFGAVKGVARLRKKRG
jgi:integrase